jgi:uncharacterized protein YndB with AHSA1/START domain
MSAQPAVATKPSLTIKRRLNASPAKVYAAWTEPKNLTQWFGPPGSTMLEAVADVRPGGRYKLVAQSPEGERHEVGGVYREVVPGEKLVFTWAWHSTPERESVVTVTIKPDGEGTLLTLLHEHFYDVEARDRHQYGWGGALDKLESFVA